MRGTMTDGGRGGQKGRRAGVRGCHRDLTRLIQAFESKESAGRFSWWTLSTAPGDPVCEVQYETLHRCPPLGNTPPRPAGAEKDEAGTPSSADCCEDVYKAPVRLGLQKQTRSGSVCNAPVQHK